MLEVEQIKAMVKELEAYHALYSPYFRTEEQRNWAYHYLAGLLDPGIERKSAENIALATVGVDGVRALQTFVGVSQWADAALLAEHRRQTGVRFGTASGVIILDGSDCAKQGAYSVGVQRQWCGELGKQANCQAGVYLGYSSELGYTLLDRRLYMPEGWFSPAYAEQRYKCHVPINLTFQTKNQLAWTMLAELQQASTLPARWVTMAEAFGRDTQLLDRIADATPYFYLAEVPKDTRVWLEMPATARPAYTGHGRPATHLHLAPDAPPATTVAALAATLPPAAWTTHALKPGAKGLILADMARLRIVTVRDGLPGPQVWLVLRRGLTDPTELHYFLSNAPADIDPHELIQVCALRWPIEIMFEQAKQCLGLNHYETRTWGGWHHHMTLVILAFGFLARCQAALKPDAPALTIPQVVELLKAVLPKPTFDAQAALDLLRYKQLRIARAKKSHYFMQKKRIIDPLLVPQ